jgi:hypothetical protein
MARVALILGAGPAGTDSVAVCGGAGVSVAAASGLTSLARDDVGDSPLLHATDPNDAIARSDIAMQERVFLREVMLELL